MISILNIIIKVDQSFLNITVYLKFKIMKFHFLKIKVII
jgi:hypothetical protein